MKIKRNSTERIKACVYLRMSTDRQDTSIEIQTKRLLELAEREGYEIIQWFKDEGRSGSKDTRKRVDWLKMLASAPTAEWEVILCYNRARFSRLDSIEEGDPKLMLRLAGKSLHTIFEGKMDWNTSEGRIVDAVHTEASHRYAVELGRGTLEGRLNAFLRGKGYGQICPYGLARRITDSQGQVHLVPRSENFKRPKGWSQVFVSGDPLEVETVLWLFNEYATKDVGYRWLARQLNEKGIPSPYGVKWLASRVAWILQNVTYVGDLQLGKRASGAFARLEGGEVIPAQRGSRSEKKAGLILQNTHQGIIERSLWNKVQEKIQRNGREERRRPRGEGGFALKGVMVCGHCRRDLYGRREMGKKGSGRIAYFCRNWESFGAECGCSGWHIEERDILPFVIGKLTEAVEMRLLAVNSVKPPPTERKEGNSEVANLERKLEALDRKIDQGYERFLTASVEHTQGLDAKLSEWRLERADLATRLELARKNKPSLKTALEEWQEWFATVGKHLIEVQTSPPTGTKLEAGEKFTPEGFRETLHSFGCRVICWWKKVPGKHRFEVDRVRILLGNDPTEQPDEVPAVQPGAETGSKAGEGGSARAVPNAPFTSVNGAFGTALIDLAFGSKDLFPFSEAVSLPLMRELRAKGATYREIADALNEQGIKTSKGRAWDWRNVVRALTRGRS